MRRGYVENETDKVNINVTKKDNKKDIIKFSICLLILIFVYYQIFVLVQYTLGKKDKGDMWLYNGINNIVTTIIPKATETTEEYTLKLAALGDIYASSNILKGAKTNNVYNFSDSFAQTKELLANYDAVIASLNTPVAGASLGYSNKTSYNAPKELLDTVKYLGISTIATAGNHLMDKGEKGVTETISQLTTLGINQIGLNSSNDRTKPYIIEKNNIKIAILSYMTTSEVKIAKGKEYLINTLTTDSIKADMEYVKSQKVDYTICYLNTPNEDASLVNSEQKTDVELLFDNGVNVVLGTGSKVVQEKLEDLYELSDGTKNHTYVVYSLGDFLGEMDTDERKLSAGMDITFTKNLTKDSKGNIVEEKTKKNMLINKPLSFYTKVTTSYKLTNYPISLTLEKYDKGTIELNTKDYETIKSGNNKIKEILKID